MTDNATTRNNKRGSVMLGLLLIAIVGAGTVAAYLRFSTGEALVTRRMIDHQKAKIAAEAALEYGVMHLRDLLTKNQLRLTMSELQGRLDAIHVPQLVPGYVHETPDGDEAFRIVVETPVTQDALITNGTLCLDLMGDCQEYTVYAGALNPETGVGAVLGTRLQAVGVFLIRYAIFYEEDLEIMPGQTMIVSGPVHGNHHIYCPSQSSLTFASRVTAVGDVIYRRGKEGRLPTGPTYIYDGTGYPEPMSRAGYILDSEHSTWISDSLQVWDGKVLSGVHGIQHLSPPLAPVDDAHDLIMPARSTNDPEYAAMSVEEQDAWHLTEDEKFMNKASIRINVDENNNITASNYFGEALTNFTTAALRTNGFYGGKPVYRKNSDGTYVVSGGCIDITQANFYDARQSTYMAPVDIYADQLVKVLTNMSFDAHSGEGLIYVTRQAPASSPGRVPCVRIRNGREIKMTAGLSVVSDCPLYMEGDYNTVNKRPSMAGGDCVTMLSRNWQDARSRAALSERTPAETSNNSVVMTGNTETEGSQYNGGVENVLRFLENWNGRTYFYRGSLIDLWYSEMATAPWSYGTYYTAPRRDWGYDPMYRTQNPPGMTRVFGLEELEWLEARWEDVVW